jgi:hypothetical protein
LKLAVRSRPSRRAGRSVGPALLWIPVLVSALWILHRLEIRPGAGEEQLGEAIDREPVASRVEAVAGFAGAQDWRGGRLELSLSPFHVGQGDPEFRRASLRARLGLDEGEPWRLVLELHGPQAEASLLWSSVVVRDARGVALRPVVGEEPAEASPATRAWRTLFSTPEALEAGRGVQVALWGRPPGEDARVELVQLDGEPLSCALEARSFTPSELPAWFARSKLADRPGFAGEADGVSSAVEEDPLQRENAELRAALQQERAQRQERELAWYEYNRALASLDLDSLPYVSPFPVDPEYAPDEDDPEAGDETFEEERRREERVAELVVSLETLFAMEGVRGMQLLEAGSLDANGLGPVVFRLLDEGGILSGSLSAERLRLEASRSARTLTLVLEDGYESRMGERTPFRTGTRRIVLPDVDPDAWIGSLPELFRASDLRPPMDDGLWDLRELRGELNRLLGLDVAAGWYRVRSLGGVMDDELVDVHLECFDTSGRIERRLFADRMRVIVDEEGVLLLLEGGAVVRGETKRGFVGGSHRVYLPRAPLAEWREARVPGLDEPRAAGGEGSR